MDNLNKYEQEVLSMSNDELKEILVNRNLYNGWLITNARKELDKRGVSLSNDELNQIEKIKKQRIDDARQEKILKQNNEKGWFIYEDFRIIGIKIEFSILRYSKRIRKDLLITLAVSLSFGLLTFVVFGRLSLDFIVTASVLASILFLIGSYNLINQNRYYLLTLMANENKIKVNYTNIDNEYELICDWSDVEIKKTKTFSRHPTTIMTLRFYNEKKFKLYSDINQGLTSDKIDTLIDNMKKLKNKAANNGYTQCGFK